MSVSLGGDLSHFVGSIGLIAALRRCGFELGRDYELRCCGFSSLAGVLWLHYAERSYHVISKMWENLPSLFPNATKVTAEGFSKRLSNLMKLRTRLDGGTPRKLVEFLERWLPNGEITSDSPVKVYSHNVYLGKEEVLTGEIRDIIAKAVVYPLDFPPVGGHVSLGWTYTFPLGDAIIYDEWNCSFNPTNGIDYFVLAFCVRRNESARLRASSAKFVRTLRFSPNDPLPVVASTFYRVGAELAKTFFSGGITGA